VKNDEPVVRMAHPIHEACTPQPLMIRVSNRDVNFTVPMTLCIIIY
jgi:hypothetical protein